MDEPVVIAPSRQRRGNVWTSTVPSDVGRASGNAPEKFAPIDWLFLVAGCAIGFAGMREVDPAAGPGLTWSAALVAGAIMANWWRVILPLGILAAIFLL